MSVDITISARDQVSRTLDAITKSVDDLNKALEEVEKGSQGSNDRVRKLFKATETEIKNVGKGMQTVGKGLTKYITKPALGAAAGLAGLTLGKGFARMKDMDEARAKLKAMGIEGENYQKIYDSANASVKGTAFAMNEAMTAAASASAAGVKNNEMQDYLTAISNTAAVAGTSFGEMGMVFNKVAANGKVTAEEWNMMTDRGVDISGALQKQLGVSRDELLKMRQAGEITADDFVAAMGSMYDGAAQAIGQSTITGAISNINASISRIGANFLGDSADADSFAGHVLPLLNSLMAAMGKVEEAAKDIGARFADMIGPTMEDLTNFFNGIADGSVKIDKARVKMAGIAGVAATALGPALTIAGKALVLFGEHGGTIKKVAGSFKKMGGSALRVAGPIALIGTAVIAAWKNSESFRASATNLFSTVLNVIKQLATAIGPLLGAVMQIIGPIMGMLGDLAAPLIDVFARVLEVILGIVAAVAQAFTPIAEGIAGAVGTAADKINELGGAWEAIKTAAKTLTVKVAGAAHTILAKIKSAWNAIKAKAKSLKVKVLGGAQALLEGIKKIWDAIRNAVSSKNFTVKVLGGALGALNSIRGAWGAIQSGTKTLKVITQKITEKFTRNKGSDEGATGIRSSPGGMTLVGERGPEILNLPKGASVHTARSTEAFMNAMASMPIPEAAKRPDIMPFRMPQMQPAAQAMPQVGGPMPQMQMPEVQAPQPQQPAGRTTNTSVTAPITIHQTNNMGQDNKGIIDDLISELSQRIGEVMASSAEGLVEE